MLRVNKPQETIVRLIKFFVDFISASILNMKF